MKRTIIAAVVAGLLALGCGGASDVHSISGVFIGTTNSGDSIAVVAHAPFNGSKRTVDAFVTDGGSVSEFVSGTASGNIFQLTNSDGEVDGTIDAFGVSGNAIFGGTASGFDIQSAASPAGLYDVTIDMNAGTVTGSSSNGATLTGTIGDTLVGNDFEVAGTISAAGASDQPVDVFITQDSDGAQEWIVFPDLSVRGGEVGSGTGFATSD